MSDVSPVDDQVRVEAAISRALSGFSIDHDPEVWRKAIQGAAVDALAAARAVTEGDVLAVEIVPRRSVRDGDMVLRTTGKMEAWPGRSSKVEVWVGTVQERGDDWPFVLRLAAGARAASQSNGRICRTCGLEVDHEPGPYWRSDRVENEDAIGTAFAKALDTVAPGHTLPGEPYRYEFFKAGFLAAAVSPVPAETPRERVTQEEVDAAMRIVKGDYPDDYRPVCGLCAWRGPACPTTEAAVRFAHEHKCFAVRGAAGPVDAPAETGDDPCAESRGALSAAVIELRRLASLVEGDNRALAEGVVRECEGTLRRLSHASAYTKRSWVRGGTEDELRIAADRVRAFFGGDPQVSGYTFDNRVIGQRAAEALISLDAALAARAASTPEEDVHAR